MGKKIKKFNLNQTKRVITEVKIEYNKKELWVKALWDTGSDICAIKQNIADTLKFYPYEGSNENYRIIHPDKKGQSFVKFAPLNYYFKKNSLIGIKTAIIEDNTDDYDIVIGMPIICRGCLKINNKFGVQVFTFKFNLLK